MNTVIAIDGPSASGKSTVARRVAAELGFIYVDSGSLYRGVTWQALRKGVDSDDADGLARLVETLNIQFQVSGSAVGFTIDGEAPGQAIRSHAVNEQVSPVSAVPAVRRRVVGWLRGLAALGDLVMEGRDIGTAVFPDAPFKFYLDASAEERARRRARDFVEQDQAMDEAQVLESLRRRDAIDSHRKLDPLTVADDAVVIDSTDLEIGEAASQVLERIRERLP